MTARKAVNDTTLFAGRVATAGGRDPGPAFVLPALPPLLMVVVFTALFDQIAELPAFDGAEYVDYLLPGAVVLTALLGAGFTAISLTTDAASGYLDRLRLLPTSGAAIVGGLLVFEGLRVLPAAAAVLAVCLALGADISGGPVGVVVCLILVGLLSAAFSGLFLAAGLLSGNPQVPLAMQPVGVLVGFVSIALVPASVASSALGDVARANPASWVVDGVRASLSGEPFSGDVALAAGVGLAGVVGTLVVGTLLLRRAGR
jgi:ABC-2 type transport system permease protein